MSHLKRDIVNEDGRHRFGITPCIRQGTEFNEVRRYQGMTMKFTKDWAVDMTWEDFDESDFSAFSVDGGGSIDDGVHTG